MLNLKADSDGSEEGQGPRLCISNKFLFKHDFAESFPHIGTSSLEGILLKFRNSLYL